MYSVTQTKFKKEKVRKMLFEKSNEKYGEMAMVHKIKT